MSYTEIRAPISGHIGRHLVDVGNLIQAETTQLAIIQSIDPIYAYFDLSELDLLRFMEMLRKHELPDPERDAADALPGPGQRNGFPHEGRLDFRELGVDPSTGTTMRRGIFPNPDGQLIPGLFARIHASIGAAGAEAAGRRPRHRHRPARRIRAGRERQERRRISPGASSASPTARCASSKRASSRPTG